MAGFKDLGTTPVKFLNTVREKLPEQYRASIPVAKTGQKDFSKIGAVLAEDDNFASMWHKTAIKMVMKILQRDNKIVNPLSEFEGELITSGEYIEEMILDAAETFQFNPTAAEKRLFERRLPDLKAVIHKHVRDVSNSKTIQDTVVTDIFQNEAGLNRYVIQVTQSILSGNEQEKYYETKELISTAVHKGLVRVVDLGSRVTAKEIQKAVLKHSKKMVHPSRYYNMGNVNQPNNKGRTGISIQADKSELRMLMPVDTSVELNVDFFASAFHLDAVKSGLAIKEVDYFPSLYEYTEDHEVTEHDLANGFLDDFSFEVGMIVPKGAKASQEAYEYAKEKGLDDIEMVFDGSRIQAVVLDRRALIINPMLETTLASQANALGRYVNIILQDKEMFSYSPFMPAVVIMADEPVETNFITDVEIDNESVVNERGVAKIPYSEDTAKAVAEVFGDELTTDQFVKLALEMMANDKGKEENADDPDGEDPETETKEEAPSNTDAEEPPKKASAAKKNKK